MSGPHYADDLVTLYLGDCLDVLREMEADSVDAIVTDPPAGIAFMDREWDDFRRARNPADAGRDNVFGRTSARGPEYGRRDRRQFVDWLTERMTEAYRVLKPGGHALVWSIPRTSHWTAWALEDAGFDIRDCVLHLFGSGFPKSLDVSKAIDKRPGVSRHPEFAAELRAAIAAKGFTNTFDVTERVTGRRTGAVANWQKYQWPEAKWWPALRDLLSMDAKWDSVIAEADREVITPRRVADRRADGTVIGLGHAGDADITAPATEDAARWEGWGTALKPGQEMWWLVRKPLAGTVAANVLEHGTGALNIAACTVAHASAADLAESRAKNPGRADKVTSGTYGADWPQQSVNDAGRWPTNIVLTHSAACEPIGLREVRSDGHHPASRGPGGLGTSGHSGQDDLSERKSGAERVEAWSCAADCPVAELDRQSGVTTSTGGVRGGHLGNGTTYGRFEDKVRANAGGLGDTGGASRFYPTFRYQAKAPASERPRLEDGTAHETVKPLGFISWAIRLITPPGGTVLDMFAGSGPVGEACVIAGIPCILIEQDPKSAELIMTRLRKPTQPDLFGMLDFGGEGSVA